MITALVIIYIASCLLSAVGVFAALHDESFTFGLAMVALANILCPVINTVIGGMTLIYYATPRHWG